MIRSNHYEAAFEGYLQWYRHGYIAVDESRRCFLDHRTIKNLDFIVYGEGGTKLLVDVKGRRFPGGPPDKPRRVWECWTHKEDIDGLLRWQDQFGSGFRAVLVFAYLLHNEFDVSQVPGDLWTWRGKRYLLRSILVDDYRPVMRQRSPKWQTVCLRSGTFRRLARPFHYFTKGSTVELLDRAVS